MSSINDAIIIAASSFVAFALAYFLYAEFISRRLFGLRKEAPMPSADMEDGVDYVPTLRHILMGHHFTSIAGAAPIVGPAIAVVWGWLPALLWVVLGSIFIGAVHDFGSVVISIRNQGRSIGDVASDYIGRVGWALFLLIIFSLLAVVIAVFAWIIAGLFVAFPSSVVPIWIEIPLAIWLGTMIYRRKKGAWLWSFVVVVLMFVAVGIGTVYPVQLSEVTVGETRQIVSPVEESEAGAPPTEAAATPTDAADQTAAGTSPSAATEPDTADTTNPAMKWARRTGAYIGNLLQGPAGATAVPPITIWLVLLLIYAFTASQLPVTTLLQPRDFMNAYKLYISMVLLFVGLCVVNPQMIAPAYRSSADIPGGKPMLPMLFVIIACGAVSGFHSLVASGTTSKQLKHETDAKLVGYGSMLVEGALAVIVIVACCAGIGLGVETDGGILKAGDAYAHFYSEWPVKSTGANVSLSAFIQGGAQFLARIGIPVGFATTLMAVIIVSFAATTLDTATRIQRYVITEIGRFRPVAFLKNRTLATFIAVLTAGWIAINQGARGSIDLWKVFGTVNQLLAGLALLTITLYLAKKGKSVWFTLVPMVFVLIVTGWAMILQIDEYGRDDNRLLLYLAAGVFLLELGVLLAGLAAAIKERKQREAQAEVDDALGRPPEDGGEPDEEATAGVPERGAVSPLPPLMPETPQTEPAEEPAQTQPEPEEETAEDILRQEPPEPMSTEPVGDKPQDSFAWEPPADDDIEQAPHEEEDATDIDLQEADDAPEPGTLPDPDNLPEPEETPREESPSNLPMDDDEQADREMRLREDEGTHLDDGDAQP